MRIFVQFLVASVFGVAFFGAALLLPAWTVPYWQAWVFIAVFSVATLVPNAYLAMRQPTVLERRLHAGPTAESRPAQRIIITATVLSVVVLLVLSAFDHRFGWSSVPLAVIVVGNVLVATGLVIAELVVIQNGYAAATITVEAGQTLVSDGLYGVVRHPMYLGGLIMLAGTPLALDSYWGLAVLPAAVVALGARILDEEKMLRLELTGYEAYAQKVRYRLIPGVW